MNYANTHVCLIFSAVSRGCFHTTFATEVGEVRCQSITSSVYCFCDTERCNNKSLYELAPSLHFDLTFSERSRLQNENHLQNGASVELQKTFKVANISVTPKPNLSSSTTQTVRQDIHHEETLVSLVSSENTESIGRSDQKEHQVNRRKAKIVKTKWYKRRHDHGLSSKQSSFPYSFQSIFRNNYVY